MSDIYKQKTIYMKNLFNNMDSSEVGRILEMHKNQGHSLSEQTRSSLSQADKDELAKAADAMTNNLSPGLDNKGKQGGMRSRDIAIPQTIEIGSSLFKNGVANIDRTNTDYKKAIAGLKKLSSDISVDIIGGASAVGSKTFGKEQNQKLAMLRASNFIKAAQSDGVKVPMTPSGEVGVATVKDSPAAEKEQFVKIEFIKTGRSNTTSDIDNTRVADRTGGDYIDPIQGGGGKKKPLFKLCLNNLTAAEFTKLKTEFKGRLGAYSLMP